MKAKKLLKKNYLQHQDQLPQMNHLTKWAEMKYQGFYQLCRIRTWHKNLIAGSQQSRKEIRIPISLILVHFQGILRPYLCYWFQRKNLFSPSRNGEKNVFQSWPIKSPIGGKLDKTSRFTNMVHALPQRVEPRNLQSNYTNITFNTKAYGLIYPRILGTARHAG